MFTLHTDGRTIATYATPADAHGAVALYPEHSTITIQSGGFVEATYTAYGNGFLRVA